MNLRALTSVDGVGPKTAKPLYETLGVRTLVDLERAAREGRIRDLCQRLLAARLFEQVEPAGSLRRGKETVGDLDLLTVSDHPEKAVDAFCFLPDVAEVLARGPQREWVRLHGGFQANLRLVPRESLGAVLQYLTGSNEHNIRLRQRAVARGVRLSEYSLFDRDGRVLAGKDEAEVYRALGLAYIPPELREDGGRSPPPSPASPSMTCAARSRRCAGLGRRRDLFSSPERRRTSPETGPWTSRGTSSVTWTS